ncbi:MAG: hypothetical protein D6710_12230 [Nitrospirae bacterium]|nr:MAG: hypothetical protein D6710_12230 [Nitrospirota bacterium]
MLGIVIGIICSLVLPAYARDIGKTYPIAEKDALKEIMERVKEVDWEKFWKEKREIIRRYRPDDIVELPVAEKTQTFTVDMSYTLDHDIPDGKGGLPVQTGILYPKGYTFNPLDYVFYPLTLVVIDPTDKRQIQWFKKIDRDNIKLLITNGDYIEVSKKLNRPVYYLTETISKRLKLRAVPSVVVQKGNVMEVTEYAVR